MNATTLKQSIVKRQGRELQACIPSFFLLTIDNTVLFSGNPQLITETARTQLKGRLQHLVLCSAAAAGHKVDNLAARCVRKICRL